MSKRYLLLLLGVLIVLSLSFLTYWAFKHLLAAVDQRKELFLENESLILLLNALQDAETGQRGYIITNKDSYLEPYQEGVNKVGAYLKSSDISNPELNYFIQLKLNELQDRIEIRRREGFESSQRAIATDQGKNYMDQIRRIIHDQLEQNRQNLNKKEQQLYLNTLQVTWISVLGSILTTGLVGLYIYLLYKDAKKRREVEQKLKQTYDLQKAILDSMSQYVITTDSNGLVTSFNHGAEKLLGYRASEVINQQSILNFYDPEMLDRLSGGEQTNFRKVINADHLNGAIASEWVLKCREGKRIPSLQTITSLKDPDTNKPRYLFIGTDMTERKTWEKHMQRALIAADAANIAKSKFLANISHDLRTPLNSIIGFSNILQKNKFHHLQEQELTYVEKILNNGKYLLSLLNEILDLSKIEAGMVEVKKVPINLSDLILDIVSHLEGKIVDKNVKLLTDIPPHIEPVETDPSKLIVLLNNLIGNALKYTNEGTVTVHLETYSETHVVSKINIIDTGIGISEENLHKIFAPFYQVDSSFSRQYEGSGLGLAISSAISQLLGYEIRVLSKEKKGSVFSIVLNPSLEPISEGQVVMPKALTSAVATQAYEESVLINDFRHLTVLLIDHDVSFLARLGQQLQDLGCKVLIASSAEKGLEIIKDTQVDLITLGIMLSPMNGYEFIEHLKADAKLKNIPYAIISIVANEIRPKLPDALDYFSKQISYSDLINLLKKAMVFQRSHTSVETSNL